jgi:hypothetical protein
MPTPTKAAVRAGSQLLSVNKKDELVNSEPALFARDARFGASSICNLQFSLQFSVSASSSLS